jgi:hypothetical protein
MRGERSIPSALRIRRLLSLAAAGDHNTETHGPWGKTAAMRKGAAVGAGPVPERRPASDPSLVGATPLPAPPCRVGLQALGRATVPRWRELGLGTVVAGFAAGSGRGRGRAARDLSRH